MIRRHRLWTLTLLLTAAACNCEGEGPITFGKGDLVPDPTEINFGQVTSISGNRQVQLSARVDF